MSHKSEMAGPLNRGDTLINNHFTLILSGSSLYNFLTKHDINLLQYVSSLLTEPVLPVYNPGPSISLYSFLNKHDINLLQYVSSLLTEPVLPIHDPGPSCRHGGNPGGNLAQN